MLYGLGDIRMRRLFIEQEAAGEERKRREHRRLDALLGYCESPSCRRSVLLDYFGEESKPCGNCDVCLDPVDMVDGVAEGQMVLSAVHQTGQRFGAVHIIDVLRGQMTEKVTAAGHDRLSCFGTGGDHTAVNVDDWTTTQFGLNRSINLKRCRETVTTPAESTRHFPSLTHRRHTEHRIRFRSEPNSQS